MPGMTGNESGGGVPEPARAPLRELMDDRLLDALLERSRDQAGGLTSSPMPASLPAIERLGLIY
jgi:hypothetical protein